MKIRKIEEKDFELILESDKKLYPTDFPVTKETIRSWYIKNPEFGMIFEQDKKIVGVFIVIPLNKESWKRLIQGELKESEMTPKTIFDNSRDEEIGLHGYHIEKFSEEIRGFYKLAHQKLGEIIRELKKANKNLKLSGLSALSVTTAGIGLAEHLGLKERTFKIDEHILEKGGNRIIANSLKESEEKKRQGYTYLNRCKMLIVYPKEQSIVWHYFK